MDRAALSHVTALEVWRLRQAAAGEPVHVTTSPGSAVRSRRGIVVHHRGGFEDRVLTRDGLPVVGLDLAVVDAWPMLDYGVRREPVIRAVNERLTTPDRLGAALAQSPRLPGRAELARLVDLLAAGCRSPLEIWGHERVFTGPGMPAFRRQHPVRLGDRTVYLDVYAEAERVDFELDGAAYHGEPGQRERDNRRDAALATLGIQVVRFGHRRLFAEPDRVRAEVLAVLAARRP